MQGFRGTLERVSFRIRETLFGALYDPTKKKLDTWGKLIRISAGQGQQMAQRLTWLQVLGSRV